MLLSIALAVVVALVLWRCEEEEKVVGALDFSSLSMGDPSGGPAGQVLEYTAFRLRYIEEHEQADWVGYLLTRRMLEEGEEERESSFEQDPNLKNSTGSASNEDYTGSGYDRGHLAPAADMAWSEAAMNESFYYSNASPQVPAFNRGIWKRLESRVREWALANDSVFVVTGPVLSEISERIGPNEVSVPTRYYKVVLDISQQGGYKGAAFVLENKGDSESELFSKALSIDELERMLGIDFFPRQDPALMEELESSFSEMDWM